jgi:hypothetical protein
MELPKTPESQPTLPQAPNAPIVKKTRSKIQGDMKSAKKIDFNSVQMTQEDRID